MRIRSTVLYNFLFNCMMLYNIILTSFLPLHLSCTTAHFYVSAERCIIPACCVFSVNLYQYDSRQMTHMSFIIHVCDNISIIICLLNIEYVCGLMSIQMQEEVGCEHLFHLASVWKVTIAIRMSPDEITYHMTVTVIGIFPVTLQDE